MLQLLNLDSKVLNPHEIPSCCREEGSSSMHIISIIQLEVFIKLQNNYKAIGSKIERGNSLEHSRSKQ